MPLLVQKFGGTSLADSGKILAAARRAIQAHKRGDQVLVVVSARGHTTDELIELAKEITENPPAREMDMLLATGEQVSVALMAMAIGSLGVPAISFTGAPDRAGDRQLPYQGTDQEHLHRADGAGARGRKDRDRRGFSGGRRALQHHDAGPGRIGHDGGGAGGRAGAAGCEIYTDVDGVYTTDPRIVPEARKIDRISYDEMLELASLGAGVMHSRSIEFAKKYGVPIHVRSSFSDAAGTWIVDEREAERLGAPVTGAALAKDEARITIRGRARPAGGRSRDLPNDRGGEDRGRHDRSERLEGWQDGSEFHGGQGGSGRNAARAPRRRRGEIGATR